MDTLIIQGKFRKIVSIQDLESISLKNEKRFNRNINWRMFREDNDKEIASCLVVPILIHQHVKGEVVFPHLRCHIVVDEIHQLMMQDMSFEQWFELPNLVQ
jgi:hypothetical protein